MSRTSESPAFLCPLLAVPASLPSSSYLGTSSSYRTLASVPVQSRIESTHAEDPKYGQIRNVEAFSALDVVWTLTLPDCSLPDHSLPTYISNSQINGPNVRSTLLRPFESTDATREHSPDVPLDLQALPPPPRTRSPSNNRDTRDDDHVR
jgi:hypothetical protein